MSKPRALIVLLLAVPLAAQEVPSTLDPETGRILFRTELVIEPVDLAGGWLELTPLAVDPPAVLIRLENREVVDGELRLAPGIAAGAAMLCTGGRPFAVLCEQVFVEGTVWIEPGRLSEVAVRFEPGIAVKGHYRLDDWPVAGARVAVVPNGLSTNRAFTMPLGVQGGGYGRDAVPREVLSDQEGRFLLPRLAAGEYFLETILPSGRVHRTEPFRLPDRDTVRRETGAPAERVVVWDLGEIDVADGLTVSFQVSDPRGSPLAGARIAGRQGETPETLVDFEATADRDGKARLSGFSAESGVHLSCRMPGYRTVRRQYSLLPVFVDCVLEPLAGVRGEVIGLDSLPVAGGMVSIEPLAAGDEAESARPPEPQEVGVTGRYNLRGLIAGEFRLRAAAPGFAVEQRTFVLAPGERRELESIVLLPGREIAGLVVDADTGKPLEQVEIRAVEPPGAALTVSDEEGKFTLATRTDESLVLQLSAPKHATRQVTVTPERLEKRKPLRFEMTRAGWIWVVVWDEAADLPCQGCRLLVRPTASDLTTDGFGEALSEALTPGSYRVYRPRVSHLGSKVIEQDNAEYRQVYVRPGKTARVRFGERRSSVRVVFRPSPGADWTLSARTARRSERVRPEPDGGFRVRHRRGESLDLYLHLYDTASGAEIEVLQATLPAELAATELVLRTSGTRVHGRAVSGGEPLAGEWVRLKTLTYSPQASARTRPDGSFSIPHVPAGVYAVFIGARKVRLISLRTGQSLDLGAFDLIAGSF